MTTSLTCAKCGSMLPGDAPQDMCPKCLIVAGLMSDIGVEADPTEDFSPSEILRAAQAPAAPAAPVIPRLFGGYRIVRPLGKGGMGTVYEAEEHATGRRLALKVLSHSLDSEQARTRFFREGRLAASVNHPNSVYVFGTEEVDGLPVITMELASGGTLQDLVKREGPLPITKAVDAILQIIAGLEAAAAKGVLHRDIKPSNCFIDSDGGVKVGDFGLSISTLARAEVNVTTTAAMVGTPAYASPEQLRGDEIDSRSDIYAVGVTLFYLLTARTPFTADNMVRLLANVLEKPADSPRTLRPEIPEELARIILRCLAKQPAQRFRNYEQLRLALLPFTSASPTPASNGLRFLSGVIDGIVALSIFIAMSSLVLPFARVVNSGRGGSETLLAVLFWAGYLLPLLTFVIPEGLWGATLGKAILGLRVVGLKRKLPGIPRAFLRAAIVFAAFVIGAYAGGYLMVWMLSRSARHSPALLALSSFLPLLTPPACVLLLFVTGRRKNDLAAVQDLLSGTRVVVKAAFQIRSAAEAMPEPAAAADAMPRIGPYHVLSEIGISDSSQLLVGYDPLLFRRVWIQQLPQGAAEVPVVLRMLTRHGRLRWLGGKRAPGENWDGYEALSGQPLTALLNHPQPWKRVRFWLTDLAAELDAALADHSMPDALGLDRVWITEDGRAKLLDFPAPSAANIAAHNEHSATAERSVPPKDGDAQLFLKQLAVAALEGATSFPLELEGYAPQVPLPLHARRLATRIGQFSTLGELLAELQHTRDMPAQITPARRLALLAGCIVPPLMASVFVMAILWPSFHRAREAAVKATPQLGQFMDLIHCLDKLQYLKATDREKGMDQALEIYIAGRFGKLVTDSQIWNSDQFRAMPADLRRKAERIVASHPGVSQRELVDSSQKVKSLGLEIPDSMKAIGANQAKIEPTSPAIGQAVLVVAAVWAILTGLPALIAAGLFRGGLLLHGLAMAVVTRDGVPARRWRVLWRAAIVWIPAILTFAVLPPLPLPAFALWSILIIVGAVYVGGAFWSLRNPQCGVQDLIAHTRIVPR